MGEIEENSELPVQGDRLEVPDEVTVAEPGALSAEPVPVESSSADDTELDDIADAISEAEDKVTAAESLDDIAPETTHAVPDDAVIVAEPVLPASVPWWPFLAYLGAWMVLTGLAVWQLLQLPPTHVAYESQVYGYMVLGGLIMTAVGPLLILAVWFAVWSGRSSGQRAGLLTSALLKGALVTLSGAILWWAALIIIDYLRLGSPL